MARIQNQVGAVTKEVLAGFQTALENGNVTEPFDISCWDVTRYVQNFIEASYQIGFNPLKHLRKAFDRFDWEVTMPPSRLEGAVERWRKEAIGRSDFFWFANGPEKESDKLAYVIARRKNTQDPPMSVFATCTMSGLAEDYAGKDALREILQAGAHDEPGDDLTFKDIVED